VRDQNLTAPNVPKVCTSRDLRDHYVTTELKKEPILVESALA